jgi:DNA-directed RNA polymerase omega subunit
MAETTKTSGNGFNEVANEQWPGIDSRFRLVILAGLRCKQLLRGSKPRIPADPLRRRNTSIALEELKQGLVAFAPAKVDPNSRNGRQQG